MPDLKSCPFCGTMNLRIYERTFRDMKPWPHVVCLDCGCGQTTIEKWNRRAPAPEQPAAQGDGLPPLPDADCIDLHGDDAFSKAAMRAYASAAIAALQRLPRMPFVLDPRVAAELVRATAKFPTWPTDPLHAVAVIGEEAGELTKAVLQAVYEPHKSTPADVEAEAVQVAATSLRFLASIDRYEYARGAQHEQPAIDSARAEGGGS